MTIKTYSFKDKNNATKTTEKLITTWYEDNGYIIKDVSDDKIYQEKDIDLIAYRKDDTTFQTKLEVKSDTYESTNYFAEVISNTNKDSLGCWLKTEADLLLYYFEKRQEVHVIPVKEAQQYVLDNYDRLKSVLVGTKAENGKVLYYTEGKLINKKALQKAMNIQIVNLSYYLQEA